MKTMFKFKAEECTGKSEVFDNLRGRVAGKQTEEYHGVPEEHGRQILQGTKGNDAVTQEKVENGITGNHAAIVKVPLPYDKSIRDFCTNDHCSDTVRHLV